MTADPPTREATASDQPGSRAADRFVIGLILVFEASAVVAVLLMLRLVVCFLLAQDHAFTQITSQAARFLAYWAVLLYVHAIAVAWFRRATLASSALCGFAGIVYLGCGYVFSLVLASAGDVHGWPEELRAFWGIVLAPNLTWLSSLAGCLLLLRAMGASAGLSSSADSAVGQSNRGTPGEQIPTPISLHETCPALLPAVGTTLLLVAAISVIVVWWTGTLVANWVLKQTADRSLDFLGAACYGGVYLLASLLALTAAVVCGRRAIQRDDPDLLWRAGVLAALGGLQHVVLLGLPALAGGMLAVRAANRRTRRPAGTLVEAIRQSWGLPGAVAFFLLTGLFFLETFHRLAQFMVFQVRMNRERHGDAATRRRGDITPSPRFRFSASPPLPVSLSPCRREFLRRSLGIALGGALVPYFSTSRRTQAQSKNDRPRLAAIGLGGQGAGIARAAMRHADLVACCDVDRRRAETFARDGKAAVYDDFRKLLDRPDVDLVTIATPDHWHAAIAIRAMRSGKDVYCEKPLTLTIEESQADLPDSPPDRPRAPSRHAAAEHGAVPQGPGVGQEGPLRPREPGHRARSAQGRRADPSPSNRRLRASTGTSGSARPPRCPTSSSAATTTSAGGWSIRAAKLTDWGAHHVDIAQWGLGHELAGPVRIDGQGVLPAGKNCYNTPTTFCVTLTFADGTAIEVRHGPDPGPWIEPSPLPVSLTCPDPRLALDNGIWFEGSLGRIFVNRKKLAGRPVDELTRSDNAWLTDAIRELYQGRTPGDHMADFFHCLRARVQPISDVFTQHRSVSSCHLCNIALRLGRPLAWDPAREDFVGDAQATPCWAVLSVPVTRSGRWWREQERAVSGRWSVARGAGFC